MVTWKSASPGDQKRLAAISTLLGKYPRLMDEIFDPNEASLRTSPCALLRGRSSGEKVLIGLALDIWNSSVGVKVIDLGSLDDENMNNVISALKFLRAR